jgi:DNA-directed RNA polymerase specialized sigma24 family protein
MQQMGLRWAFCCTMKCNSMAQTLRAEEYGPSRGSIEAWLGGVARSRAMDRLRSRRSPGEAPRSSASRACNGTEGRDAVSPGGGTGASRRREAVRRALGSSLARLREVASRADGTDCTLYSPGARGRAPGSEQP